MMVLVSYDINTTSARGQKRLSRAAKECLKWGMRVQNSVYECEVNAEEYRELKEKLTAIIHKKEDSLRFYRLGDRKRYELKVETVGNTVPPCQRDYII